MSTPPAFLAYFCAEQSRPGSGRRAVPLKKSKTGLYACSVIFQLAPHKFIF